MSLIHIIYYILFHSTLVPSVSFLFYLEWGLNPKLWDIYRYIYFVGNECLLFSVCSVCLFFSMNNSKVGRLLEVEWL